MEFSVRLSNIFVVVLVGVIVFQCGSAVADETTKNEPECPTIDKFSDDVREKWDAWVSLESSQEKYLATLLEDLKVKVNHEYLEDTCQFLLNPLSAEGDSLWEREYLETASKFGNQTKTSNDSNLPTIPTTPTTSSTDDNNGCCPGFHRHGNSPHCFADNHHGHRVEQAAPDEFYLRFGIKFNPLPGHTSFFDPSYTCDWEPNQDTKCCQTEERQRCDLGKIAFERRELFHRWMVKLACLETSAYYTDIGFYDH